MKPWTIDADDVHVADDFDAHLFHKTPAIAAFLEPRHSKFLVVATKGLGKTLLLKAQRILSQQGGAVCIPESTLLDKPAGDKIMSGDTVRFYGNSTQPWVRLWLMAIALAVLKRLEQTADLPARAHLRPLLDDPHVRTVFDHFVALLDLPPQDVYRCANESDRYVMPRIRALSTPVAVFIDSVDEYFNKHLEGSAERTSDAGAVAAAIWYFSQMGLVEAAYQLRRTTHQLKVFAAIRKEAFLALGAQTPMAQQYRGSALDISYSQGALREIFVQNVLAERANNLAVKGRREQDPLLAFCGRHEVAHGMTGEREGVFEYLVRHTLGRPRDLMTLGQHLAALAPEERAEDAVFQAAVRRAAIEICEGYLNEVAPYCEPPRLRRTLGRLTGPVVPRAELEELHLQHCIEGEAAGETTETAEHLFCLLYRVGLLGWVERERGAAREVQRFLRPGDVRVEGGPPLPMAAYYLVHPILSELLAREREAYRLGLELAGIVGDGQPWSHEQGEASREVRETLCVLKADIVAYSGFMTDPRAETAVSTALREAVAAHARDCLWVEVAAGDGVTIVDARPATVLRAAARIREDLFAVAGHPRLRVAVDCGPVGVGRDAKGLAASVRGQALRVAARLEPHVAGGEIWATDAFREACRTQPVPYGFVEAPGESRGAESGWRNVRKADSDEDDIWVRVYRVEIRAAG